MNTRPKYGARRNWKPGAATSATPPPGCGDGVEGTVDSIVFRSEATGYTVCRVKVKGAADPVVVVGTCAAIWVGETLRAEGEWVRHPQHGSQFQASRITCIVPTSAKGVERYLASGMIRGIGEVMACRLVARFGADTLKVIEKESARLEEVDGIGPKRRQRIKDSWIEQKAVRDIMIFLQSHGVGTAQSARIYRHFGSDSIAVISENPYRLCDIWGIGFKSADRVAASIGIARDSEARARAGLAYTLETMTDEGHCFCPKPELILRAQELLDIPAERLMDALAGEVRARRLADDGDRIYLPRLLAAETAAAQRLRQLMAAKPRFEPIVVEKALPWAAKRMGIEFAPAQGDALRMALSEKASIITGGPGVGKTTIIRAITDIFGVRRLLIRLAAPTGRAAKRMEEATGLQAQTLHRLLGYEPGGGRFVHGADNRMEGDVFVVDEVSMVDLPLMAAFLEALPDGAHLVLVGDKDQLPSVGPGNVLRDLLESGVVPATRLDTVFRQADRSWIVHNAHRVNQGMSLELPGADEETDFYFVEAEDAERALRAVLDLAVERIPAKFGFDPVRDVQVLTPMRRNQLGADNLNALLQERLNPSGKQLTRYGRVFRVGDRVMQVRNNYDKDVFNGDIGRIESADEVDQELVVNFEGKRVTYDLSDLDELVLAYSCSIHKSQGSEYPAAVILMTTQHYKLLQRNLLYTAITRGRRLVCIVGSSKAVWMAIRNDEIRMRRTWLRERLGGAFR